MECCCLPVKALKIAVDFTRSYVDRPIVFILWNVENSFLLISVWTNFATVPSDSKVVFAGEHAGLFFQQKKMVEDV